MLLLNPQREKRKYVARPGIEPRTSDLRDRCPTELRGPASDLKRVSDRYVGYDHLFLFCKLHVVASHLKHLKTIFIWL